MNALFIANIEMDENEGIYKKVLAEATAIKHVLGTCDLVTRFDGKAKVKKDGMESFIQPKTVLDYTLDRIKDDSVDFIYIRHMIPSPKLIMMLKIAKNKNIKIYYEIPTYPYFGEQFKASRKKYRAIIKIGLDVVFWPSIYKYIDKLVIIRSSSKAKVYKKMVQITNGVRVDNIKSKTYSIKENDVFRMVTVGTLFPYHGYDRVLKGMAACHEHIGNINVEFHVVGSSQTIDDLHKMADELGLHKVYFHGVKTTEELNLMYEQFNVGLGCLALHRRNADIDTTLKIIEYYCRGVPVISSGKCPISDERFSHIVADNEEPIDIAEIYDYYCRLTDAELKSISEMAKKQFAWDSIMRKCINDV
nr:glycosyltransferase [uncultured Mediterraneibacter sp.]